MMGFKLNQKFLIEASGEIFILLKMYTSSIFNFVVHQSTLFLTVLSEAGKDG